MAKIAYATKVSNGGTTAAGLVSPADMNDVKASVNALYDTVPYTSVVFQLSQPATSTPTKVELFNNTGRTLTVAKAGTGSFTVALSGASLPQAKCVIFGGDKLIHVEYSESLGNTILIGTYNAEIATDGVLSNSSFEFRIYP